MDNAHALGDLGCRYWDLNWSKPGGKDIFDVISGTIYTVVHKDQYRVEVSFYRPYDPSTGVGIPLNIDKRFALMQGCSGFYTYSIYERPNGWPAFSLNQTRIVFKLSKDRFRYMAIADDRQRLMPAPEDLNPDRSQQLAYPEAHILTNPVEPCLRDEVDDKYQYSKENWDHRVHGWISGNPMVGFWIITPSDEFRNGGPTKQNLTSHVGPTCLSVFHSAHYAGLELCPSFEEGEAWQKVFGPIFIYLNAAPHGAPYFSLWENAKAQVEVEMRSWPYSWPASPDYAKAQERGIFSGRLLVCDQFTPPYVWGGAHAFVGLATPGDAGSWQKDSKGYQFWTEADGDGCFSIKHIQAGVYDLYGWVPGVVGDYKYENGPIHIQPGVRIHIGEITYRAPRFGPTVWDIGFPDRTATGFYVPDPNPKYVNRLYLNSPQKWRQYGLWERYTELYPNEDLVYTVGTSNWQTDWFFAHLNRIMPDGSYTPTTWQVQFELPEVSTQGFYKLLVATASSSTAAIQLFVNNPDARKPVFDTMQYGKDNSIARHGIRGIYRFWVMNIDPKLFHVGHNTVFLRQRKAIGPFTGVMYDYLRLEAPCPDHSEGVALA